MLEPGIKYSEAKCLASRGSFILINSLITKKIALISSLFNIFSATASYLTFHHQM